MKQLLLIIVLTICYYVVLFWFDRKGRKAFKAKQQALIAKTAELPTIETTVEPSSDLLGNTTNLATVNFLASRKEELAPSVGLSTELKGNMKKLATELEMENPPTAKRNDLMANLKSTTDITKLNEEETTNFINSITKQPNLSTEQVKI